MKFAAFVAALICFVHYSHAQTPGWDGQDCDLHAKGFTAAMKKPNPAPVSLDGLYINCGSGSTSHGFRTNYCLSTNDEGFLLQMAYAPYNLETKSWGAAGWYVTSFNDTARTGDQYAWYLRCITSECANAKSPNLISPDNSGWEVSYDHGYTFESLGAPVNTSCCDSTPAKCGETKDHKACDRKTDCAQYKSFWSCVGASVTGCCQAFGWIDQGTCLCKNTRPACKPIDGTNQVTSKMPHDNFPLPWTLYREQ